MPDRCSIPECRAVSNRQFGKLSMFRIPKDAPTRAKWLKSLGKKDWNPGEKAVVCERHFEDSAIVKNFGIDKNGRRFKSKITDMPTILVPLGAEDVPVEGKARRKRRGRIKKLLEVRKKKGKRKRSNLDSMPLQQRLTSIASASNEPEKPEKPVPTLKSQPLSPTKLKVTRQSTSKPQQQKPVEDVPDPVKEEICLKWNAHHSNLQTAFPTLLNKEQYCDVTLVAEGRSLKCHKLILSSCSSYFDAVLEKVVPYQHPIIFMKDIPFDILKALCDFMYVGEVNIVQSDLDQILTVGESLKIKGLASRSEVTKPKPVVEETPVIEEPPQKTPSKSSRTRSKPVVVSEKKDLSNNDSEITDPLDLMEKTYEEAATPDVPPPALKRNDSTRKSTGKRVRKRKHVEVDHEPSPPVFRMRKGTRSRPNVKVPRYFNANFDNSAPPAAPEPSELPESSQPEETYIDSYMNILEQIKTEPLDIEDGLISFEEDSFNHPETEAMQQDDTPPQPGKTVKRRRLSRSAKLDPLNVSEKDSETELYEIENRAENSDRENVLENSDAQMEMEDRSELEFDHVEEEETENSVREDLDEVEMDIEEHEISFTPVEDSQYEDRNIENSDVGERDADNGDNVGRSVENSEEGVRDVENSEEGVRDVENSETHVENSVSMENQDINISEIHAENGDFVRSTPELENSDKNEFETVDEEIAEQLENSIEVENVDSANVSKEISEIVEEVDRVEDDSYHGIRIENSFTDKVEEEACEVGSLLKTNEDVEMEGDREEITGLNEESQVTTISENAESNAIVENVAEDRNTEKSCEENPQESDDAQTISTPKEDVPEEISTQEEKKSGLT